MTREINGIDELEALVGQQLGASDWLTVDQHMIDLFAEATGDHQWIHVDPERAAAGPYGSTIAHGFLTLSLISKLKADVVEVTGVRMTINYGLNKARFPQPVPVGSRIRDVITLSEVTRRDSGVQVVMNHRIEIDGAERPACIADAVVLLIEN